MTGRILAAKDPDSRRAVASIQKLLTAIVVLESGSLDKKVIIQAIDGSVEPTKLYLKPGEVYTRRELLKVILVKSANDASMALARDVAGSKEAFAQRMNAKARALGMMNSQFQNPHGLTEPNQYSTARDIALLARTAYQYSFIRQCMKIKQYTFVYNDGRTKSIESTNKVLKRLPYANGMKTGTTNAAGRCLASSGALNGRVVIAVVLKSNTANIWNDSEKLLRWALETPGASASN
jgi:D-alanyl-D-alanine carboxypeptidase (penicillin-binding protein 5/6)